MEDLKGLGARTLAVRQTLNESLENLAQYRFIKDLTNVKKKSAKMVVLDVDLAELSRELNLVEEVKRGDVKPKVQQPVENVPDQLTDKQREEVKREAQKLDAVDGKIQDPLREMQRIMKMNQERQAEKERLERLDRARRRKQRKERRAAGEVDLSEDSVDYSSSEDD